MNLSTNMARAIDGGLTIAQVEIACLVLLTIVVLSIAGVFVRKRLVIFRHG